jgi:phosphoribosylglycinamide formyltransferase-1
LTRIHDEIEKGTVKAKIGFVFCSREPGDAEGSDTFIELVKSYRLPLVCLSSKRFRTNAGAYLSPAWRLEYDREAMKRLKSYKPDLCVLAGYMRVVTSVLLRAFPMRVMNIHPALLPSFPGTHVWQAEVDYGVKFSGCTVHFVDEGTDTGPIIIQAVVPVYDDDTADTLTPGF